MVISSGEVQRLTCTNRKSTATAATAATVTVTVTAVEGLNSLYIQQ